MTVASRDTCALVKKMILVLAEEPPSAYAASLADYDPSLPCSWHEDALWNVAALPPADWTRHVTWFKEGCLDLDRPEPTERLSREEARALYLVVGRAGANEGTAFMAPIYDLYNHRNGRSHNTKVNVAVGTSVKVSASRDVEAGEGGQIHDGKQVKVTRSIGWHSQRTSVQETRCRSPERGTL